MHRSSHNARAQAVPELGSQSLALTYKDSQKRRENVPGRKSWHIPLSHCGSVLLFAFVLAFISMWCLLWVWEERWAPRKRGCEGSAAQHLSKDPQAPRALLQAGWGSQLAAKWDNGNFTITGAHGASWWLYGLHTDRQSTPRAEAAVTHVPKAMCCHPGKGTRWMCSKTLRCQRK